MAKIKLNDLTMYYEVHGRGTPLICISGFGCDHSVWTDMIDLFKNKYQLILFDNRGAGQTDCPTGPYTVEQMSNDVVNLCEELNIHHAHFIGNSMGGFILQHLAWKQPKLVKSATISHSATNINTPFHVYVEAQLELMKARAPMNALLKASCAWAFSHSFLSKKDVLTLLIKMGMDNPYPFSLPGYEGQYAAISQFDSRAWLKNIHVPTLVLASDQDLIFSETTVKELAKAIPEAQYHCFKQCGHLPQIEMPQQLANVVLTFVDSIDTVSPRKWI
jgi:3-oxoadipate enol-lactonase